MSLHPLPLQANRPKAVSVLGSTGSIGRQTVRLLQESPDRFRTVALTANENAELLAEQAKALRAEIAVIASPERYQELKDRLQGTGIEVAAGVSAVTEAATRPTDLLVAAMMGFAGLSPTLEAVRQGTPIALANKEVLVAAGEMFMRAVAQHNSRLLPIDSEHNALFQVFEQPEAVEKITLTASGGPFRGWTREQMAAVTPEQAVNHPKWAMGAKISVDSATLMNKGLECIEAYHLFPVRPEQIDVLIHPESVVHSLVHYADGSVLAQLGLPDMSTPIAYSLGWPERLKIDRPRLNLADIGSLHFSVPHLEDFPCLRLARQALAEGGSAPTVLNAANEIAVETFLQGGLPFLHIAELVEQVLSRYPSQKLSTLEEVHAADAEARRMASELLGHSPR